jgi:hypothetical protein
MFCTNQRKCAKVQRQHGRFTGQTGRSQPSAAKLPLLAKRGQTGGDARSAINKIGYRVPEFCQAVGISRASVYELIKLGKLRSVLIAGLRIIPVTEAERLVREGS